MMRKDIAREIGSPRRWVLIYMYVLGCMLYHMVSYFCSFGLHLSILAKCLLIFRFPNVDYAIL